MSHQKCVFCHKVRSKGIKCSFFSIPKQDWARERWVAKCGPVLKKSSIVCQDHFLREDFINPPGESQTARLLPRAVPCVNIVPVALGTQAEISAKTSLQASEKRGSKSEVEPFQLIDEKLFDELVVPTGSPSDPDKLINTSISMMASPQPAEDLRRTSSKTVQTGFPDSRTCALVEINLQKMCYTLHCFHCAEEFALGSWMEFVKHVYTEHNFLLLKEENSDDLTQDNGNHGEELLGPHVVILDELPEQHKPPEQRPCELCAAVFGNECELQEHKKVGHLISEFAYKCEICNYLYTNVRSFASHEATHHEFYCKNCRKPFDTGDELQSHKKYHKTISKLTYCELCHKSFKSHRCYHLHFRRQHNRPTYTCHLCGKVYHSRTHLVSHIKAHKNQRDYICDECGMSFVRSKNLKSHKLVHSKGPTPRVVCTICNQRFSAYPQLMNHKKEAHFVLEGTIEELEAMVPPVKRRYRLKTIIDPVDNRRRLVCDECGKSYRHHGGLNRHRKKEHNQLSRHNSRKQIKEKKTANETVTENIFVAEKPNIMEQINEFEPEDEIDYIMDHLDEDTDEEDSSVV